MTREEKVACVEACWPKWPQFYDAGTDTFRDITQEDVDRLQFVLQEYGKLVMVAAKSRENVKVRHISVPI